MTLNLQNKGTKKGIKRKKKHKFSNSLRMTFLRMKKVNDYRSPFFASSADNTPLPRTFRNLWHEDN